MTQMNLSAKQKQTHRRREQTCSCQGGRGAGGGVEWQFWIGRCELLHIEWINNELLLYSIELYSISWGKP